MAAMPDHEKWVTEPEDVTVWNPGLLGIVDSLELGDDLDVEAFLERDHYDPGLDDNDDFYWSNPGR